LGLQKPFAAGESGTATAGIEQDKTAAKRFLTAARGNVTNPAKDGSARKPEGGTGSLSGTAKEIPRGGKMMGDHGDQCARGKDTSGFPP